MYDPFPALAVAVIDTNVSRLERSGTPDPQAARELLRLARAVELDIGRATPASAWLIDYLAACRSVEAVR